MGLPAHGSFSTESAYYPGSQGLAGTTRSSWILLPLSGGSAESISSAARCTHSTIIFDTSWRRRLRRRVCSDHRRGQHYSHSRRCGNGTDGSCPVLPHLTRRSGDADRAAAESAQRVVRCASKHGSFGCHCSSTAAHVRISVGDHATRRSSGSHSAHAR